MKKLLLAAVAVSTLLVAAAPAEARDHHRPRYDRGHHGRHYVKPVRRAWVQGRFYPGRGYYHNHRWYKQRYRHHGGWRYR